MNSTLNLATGNPDAVLTARADERLAHAYEQIAHADEQLARVTEQLSKLEHGAVRQPSVVPGLRPSADRPAARGFVGFLLAACICAAAFVWQSPYGEAARLTIAQWAPQLVSTSSPWSANPGNSARPSPPAVQLASAEAALPQPAPVRSLAQDVAPTPVPMPAELTQLLQTMARDIATVEQGIEQLKVSQERIATDNGRAIEQLKASQEQMARLVAKPSGAGAKPVEPKSSEPKSSEPKSSELKPTEQDARARTPTPPPRPVANATQKPAPPQARARPPIQLQPQEQ